VFQPRPRACGPQCIPISIRLILAFGWSLSTSTECRFGKVESEPAGEVLRTGAWFFGFQLVRYLGSSRPNWKMDASTCSPDDEVYRPIAVIFHWKLTELPKCQGRLRDARAQPGTLVCRRACLECSGGAKGWGSLKATTIPNRGERSGRPVTAIQP
jgi:hypothetical protein